MVEIDPIAAVATNQDHPSESVPDGTSSGSGEGVACPLCERVLPTVRGAKLHYRHVHGLTNYPPEWGTPSAKRSTPVRKTTEGAKDGELKLVEKQLEESIDTLGSVVAAVLGAYKEFAITCRVTGTRLQVPKLFAHGPLSNVQPFDPPYFETTIGHVISADAPISSKIIMRKAEKNETLLRWVKRFNIFMHFETDAGVVSDHVMGLVHTVSPQSGVANKYLAWQNVKVLEEVHRENMELQAKIAELQERLNQETAQRGTGRS